MPYACTIKYKYKSNTTFSKSVIIVFDYVLSSLPLSTGNMSTKQRKLCSSNHFMYLFNVSAFIEFWHLSCFSYHCSNLEGLSVSTLSSIFNILFNITIELFWGHFKFISLSSFIQIWWAALGTEASLSVQSKYVCLCVCGEGCMCFPPKRWSSLWVS